MNVFSKFGLGFIKELQDVANGGNDVKKTNSHIQLSNLKILAAVELVASVALTALSLSFGFVGIPIVAIGLTFAYANYNAFKILNNADCVINNGGIMGWTKIQIKEQLIKDTFYFGVFADIFFPDYEIRKLSYIPNC